MKILTELTNRPGSTLDSKLKHHVRKRDMCSFTASTLDGFSSRAIACFAKAGTCMS